jgi:hypothetical protein
MSDQNAKARTEGDVIPRDPEDSEYWDAIYHSQKVDKNKGGQLVLPEGFEPERMRPGEYRQVAFEQQGQTRAAPTWNIKLGEKQLDLDLKELREFLLEKETYLKENFPAASDGATKLGPNSVTSRFQYFNLMNFDHPVIKQLKKEIKRFHGQFTRDVYGLTYTPPSNLRIRSWFNVMRKGERIHKHSHSLHPHTYYGGHFTVSCNQTATIYVLPYEHAHELDLIRRINQGEGVFNRSHSFYVGHNIPGQMSIFPNYVPHFTTRHAADEERVTIAFDITPLASMFRTDAEELPML